MSVIHSIRTSQRRYAAAHAAPALDIGRITVLMVLAFLTVISLGGRDRAEAAIKGMAVTSVTCVPDRVRAIQW